MKRGAPLRRTGGPLRRTPLTATSSPRSQPKRRDWRDARAKVAGEGRCRVCGSLPGWPGIKLEAAHTIGREHDRPRDGERLWVNPDDVVPLCDTCHRGYDARGLDLLPYLTLAEQLAAVRAAGGLEAARRRLKGSRDVPMD